MPNRRTCIAYGTRVVLSITMTVTLATTAFLTTTCRADDVSDQQREPFNSLFAAPQFAASQDIDRILIKILTPNDDSGRHGVLIPTAAWNFFPPFPELANNPRDNQTVNIETVWRSDTDEGHSVIASHWKHYARYPERRLTALRSSRLNDAPANSLLAVGGTQRSSSSEPVRYRCRVIYPDDAEYSSTLTALGFDPRNPQPGLFGIVSLRDRATQEIHSEALTAFLKHFDEISSRGFITTLRAGSTGIGYTLEMLLGIEENNSRSGDFLGMELKAFRDQDLNVDESEKMNLFLKEPTWTDGLSSADRVQTYGYVDPNGRTALYSTVTINRSSHGFRFRIDDATDRVYLNHDDADVAFWTFETLNTRLLEKHAEAVFIGARSRHSGRDEQFHYRTVVYAAEPSVHRFIELIRVGHVLLELRMHLQPSGSVRNHGTAFRIKQNQIPQLYATTVQFRPKGRRD